MTVLDSVQQCYGCSACVNICPFHAISMKENEYGFLKAEIDTELCQNCGKCIEVCPRLNNKFENSHLPKCFAAWANDSIRLNCASGGIFSAIAEEFLEDDNSYIVGAIWDSDYYVKHIVTSSKDDLEDIKKSKYVQSALENVFSEIKQLLDNGNRVLFSGCPCQVAGLYSFLGKRYEKLYTVDLICHGTPSQKMLKKYLIDDYREDNIEKVDFRDKSVFGWSTEMNIYFKDKDAIHRRAKDDAFYQAFLSNMSLNPVCESCQFSRIPRQGDISIGDFWDISKYKQELSDGKGTSLVLINNDQGFALFNNCSLIEMKEEVPVEFVRQTCNKTIFEPFVHHYGRNRFLKDFQRLSFDKAVEQCKTFHYDIGLVTTWFARNFGAIFTAYALYKKLEELGYSVLMLNKPRELWTDGYFSPERNTMAYDFGVRNYNLSKQYYISDIPNIEQLNQNCDMFVLGSDQLWNPKVYASLYYYFLDFVDSKNKKISYATSIGADKFEGTEEDAYRISYLLRRFDAISVRENEAVEVCKESFDIAATQVLDPVFLLDRKYYDELIKESKVSEKEKFILAYILDGNLDKKRIIDHIAELYKMRIVCAYDIENPKASMEYLGYESANISCPEDWLWYIKHAEFIVTDSYHGSCFSVIYEKQFVCFSNSMRGKNRFFELFGMLQLRERVFENCNADEAFLNKIVFDKIDYNSVNNILNDEKQRSLSWLLSALKLPQKHMDMEGFVLDKIKKSQQLEQIDRNKLNAFSNISQLELPRGVTVQEIIDKMPINSYLQQVQGNLGNPIKDTPVPYGILTIKKVTDYFVEVQFSQVTYKTTAPKIYIANLIDGKVSTWEQMENHQDVEEKMDMLKNELSSCRQKICNLLKKILIF